MFYSPVLRWVSREGPFVFCAFPSSWLTSGQEPDSRHDGSRRKQERGGLPQKLRGAAYHRSNAVV